MALRRYLRRGKHFFLREFVTRAADIPTDTAIQAILDTAVGNLDEPAQIDFRAHSLHFDPVSGLAKRRLESGVFTGDGGSQPFPVQCKR